VFVVGEVDQPVVFVDVLEFNYFTHSMYTTSSD